MTFNSAKCGAQLQSYKRIFHFAQVVFIASMGLGLTLVSLEVGSIKNQHKNQLLHIDKHMHISVHNNATPTTTSCSRKMIPANERKTKTQRLRMPAIRVIGLEDCEIIIDFGKAYKKLKQQKNARTYLSADLILFFFNVIVLAWKMVGIKNSLGFHLHKSKYRAFAALSAATAHLPT